MTRDELIAVAEKIITSQSVGLGKLSEALEFFRVYVGTKSVFYKQLSDISNKMEHDYLKSRAVIVLKSYISYLQIGLETGLPLEQKISIDTVSDYMEQATLLLKDKKYHAGAACTIIGASLEEFLRAWVESLELNLINTKPSIDSFSKCLRELDLITKQDYKDITAWAGLRNDAAHGLWANVEDRNKIELMLLGVNNFMRKYSK